MSTTPFKSRVDIMTSSPWGPWTINLCSKHGHGVTSSHHSNRIESGFFKGRFNNNCAWKSAFLIFVLKCKYLPTTINTGVYAICIIWTYMRINKVPFLIFFFRRIPNCTSFKVKCITVHKGLNIKRISLAVFDVSLPIHGYHERA